MPGLIGGVFGGELEIGILDPVTGEVADRQIVQNTMTRRGLHWLLCLGTAFVIPSGTSSNQANSDISVPSGSAGLVGAGMVAGTGVSGSITVSQGAIRPYLSTDQSQGTGTAGATLLNPFKYLAFSTSTTVQSATADTVPGTIISTINRGSDSFLAATVFQEATRVGTEWTRGFAAGAVNGTIGSIAWCNYTNGQGMGAHAVLSSPIDGASVGWFLTYRIYANW